MASTEQLSRLFSQRQSNSSDPYVDSVYLSSSSHPVSLKTPPHYSHQMDERSSVMSVLHTFLVRRVTAEPVLKKKVWEQRREEKKNQQHGAPVHETVARCSELYFLCEIYHTWGEYTIVYVAIIRK